MPFCSNCGNEIDVNAKFCVNCGEAITKHSQQQEQRKTVYDGTIHKCPNCGEQLNSFETKCSGCGYELRNSNITSCVHELSVKLEKTNSVDKKIELISNFYIPNTKEDIYEFFILAYSNISARVSEVDAWIAKLEQAYLKAKLTFGKDDEFLYIQELYEKIKTTSKKKIALNSKTLKYIIMSALGFIMIVTGLIGYIVEIEDVFLVLLFLGIIPFLAGVIMFSMVEFKSILRK